jgi:hypothetical protein
MFNLARDWKMLALTITNVLGLPIGQYYTGLALLIK